MEPIDKLIRKIKVEMCIIECLRKMCGKSERRDDMKKRLEILKKMRAALENKPLE